MNIQGAYVYRFDFKRAAAALAQWTGQPPGVADDGQFAVRGNAASWLLRRRSPIIVHEQAWSDLQFENLPEFQKHRFEGVVSIPLMNGQGTVGMANFCRSRRAAVQPRGAGLFPRIGPASGRITERIPSSGRSWRGRRESWRIAS